MPGLQPAIVGCLARMRALADELLVLCAAALGLEPDFFTRHTGHATHTMNVNWYPPMAVAGAPEPGQFRIGPHTDFGTVTILDREPGRGGLQVWTAAGRLGGRALRARRLHHQHRRPAGPVERRPVEVQPAPGAAAAGRGAGRGPRSLVYFYEADHDAVIESLRPPIGRRCDYAPVVSAQFLKERLDAITIA